MLRQQGWYRARHCSRRVGYSCRSYCHPAPVIGRERGYWARHCGSHHAHHPFPHLEDRGRCVADLDAGKYQRRKTKARTNVSGIQYMIYTWAVDLLPPADIVSGGIKSVPNIIKYIHVATRGTPRVRGWGADCTCVTCKISEKSFCTDREPPLEYFPEDYACEVNARFERPALVKVSLSETQRCSDRKYANDKEPSCPNFACCLC